MEPGRQGDDNSALAHLKSLIASSGDGFLPFESFMREALYHPQFGYYARRISTVGQSGDFSTSATLHGALGTALAAWATDRRGQLLPDGLWHLIELGGGTGQMAAEILSRLSWWSRRKLSYHIVERSETLRMEQGKRLSEWPMISWHQEIEEALQAASGEALIVSNEFVDAFPCVRLEWSGMGGWREIGSGWDEATERLVERSRPWQVTDEESKAFHSSIFDPEYTKMLAMGQRSEWHLDYARWLQRWASRWTRGALLTIDYGDLLPTLYYRRPTGTARAYYQHRRCTGNEIYARLGEQDITADVNFTDLVHWGASLGMETIELCTQADFLRRWLPVGYTRRHENDPAYHFLMNEAGAGAAFKVLEEHRI